MLQKQLGTACLLGFVLVIGLGPARAGQLGSRSAEEWIETLDRPERVDGLKIDEVGARLRLKPGDVVADLGAGSGVFTIPFAKTVSPNGTVYAVEIDPDLLDHINQSAQAQSVTNVHTVLGEFADPNLPAQNVDVAFFHDVLHHIEDRAGYLRNLAPYLKASGRIAIIERDSEHGGNRDRAELHLTQDQVTAWMADVGFSPSEEHYLFDEEKWFVVYSRR